MLADSVSGYLHKLRIHSGRDTQLVQPTLPHTVRVVLMLSECLHNERYDLCVDHVYSSPLLAKHLTDVGITLTGTKRFMNKKI